LQSWRNKRTIGLYSVNISKCPLIGLQRKFTVIHSHDDGHKL